MYLAPWGTGGHDIVSQMFCSLILCTYQHVSFYTSMHHLPSSVNMLVVCLSCALDCDGRAACVYLSCLFATDSSREESLQYERMVSASPEEMKMISSHQSEKLGIGKSRDTRILWGAK